MIKNDRGAALPIALIVMLVMTLLGTALWQYSMADTIQVARTENSMKAFYIARSGAEATAAWMEKSSNTGDLLINQSAESNTFGDGTYSVEVVPELNNRVRIDSTATVNGVLATASLLLNRYPALTPGEPITTNTIVAINQVTIGGNVTVNGIIEADPENITENGNPTIGGTVSLSEDPYPEPIFPSLTAASPYNINLQGGSEDYYITQGEYGTIESNSRTFVFDTGGGNVQIIVDKFQTRNSNVRVEGEGTVYIYVNELIDLKGHTNYMLDEDGNYVAANPQQFVILLKEGSSASLPKGNSIFSGHVYGPSAHVNFEGTQNFKGTIVAGTVSLSGNAEVGEELDEGAYLFPDEIEFASTFEVAYWVSQ